MSTPVERIIPSELDADKLFQCNSEYVQACHYDSLQAQVEVLRDENRKQRDALFQLSYPPDPKALREIADEIDCGPDCEHGHVEWDTNAHNCSRERRDEGCAAMKAWELRQFADAIETRAALNQAGTREVGK